MKQLVCPKCKHEFTYFNGEVDAKIAKLKKDATRLIRMLKEYNTLPQEKQKERSKWHKFAKVELAKINEELSALKEWRKLNDQQIKQMEFLLFKELTKEAVGAKIYHEIIKKMEADLEAYKVSGCMMHEYTRSQHMSSVTSINKL